jgi:hypothetical protein
MDVGSISAALAHWPSGWIVIGVGAILIAVDVLRSGSNRAVSFALALPVVLFAQDALSHAFVLGNILQQLTVSYVQAIVFGILLVVVYLLIQRMIGFYGSSSGTPFSAIIVGIACAILAVVIWLQTPALNSLWQFGPQVQTVFSEAYRFWWMAGAYLALAIARS